MHPYSDRITLKDYQIAPVNDLRKKMIFRASCGSGKSIMFIWKIGKIYREGEPNFLLICTKSTLPQWNAYKKKFNLPVDIYTKDTLHKGLVSKQKVAQSPHPKTGRPRKPKLVLKLTNPHIKYRAIFIDEVFYFASHKSAMSKILNLVIKNSNPEYIYGASATPYSNPWNVYAYYAMFGNPFKYESFEFEFYDVVEKDRFFNDINVPIRLPFLKKDNTTKTKLLTYMDNICHTTLVETGIAHEEIIKVGITYTSPDVYGGKHDIYRQESMTKEMLEALDMQVEEGTIICCYYKSQVDELMKRYKCKGVSGDHKYEQGFMDIEKHPILVVQIDSGTGFELPNHQKMVFINKSWSYVNYQQCRGRISRVNNFKDNFYIHLVPYYIDMPIDTIAIGVEDCMTRGVDFDPLAK